MRSIKGLAVASVWAAAAMFVIGPGDRAQTQSAPTATEAPTGFDGEDNGFAAEFCANQDALVDSPNSPMIPEDECNLEAAEEEFTGPETIADGLGPIFNAAGCGDCHTGNPSFDPDNHERKLVGATSQITESRAGKFLNGVFTDHPGGSLIQSRSLRPNEQERVLPGHNVLALRNTISILGDGFVEAIGNQTLRDIAAAQPSSQRGQVINVPVLERPGATRVGRFGHKGQQASLVSFSADAYVNEMGITSPLQPVEPTSNGNAVEDPVEGVDDEGVDVELFALFMRSTKAPPVDATLAASAEAREGRRLFDRINCDTCHTPTIQTTFRNDRINGGALRVPAALADKIIHPFADFLLHDVGTGDGIVQNGGPLTRNKIRTAALWGLRARGRFMHDNASLSVEDAIRRHRNQAQSAQDAFNALRSFEKNQVLAFLNSL